MEKITLILDRRNRNLWIEIDDTRISVGWDVDGVKKADELDYYRVMRDHKQVGLVWDVKEVREEW